MYVEMPRVIRHIKMVDSDALVIVTTVTDLEGKLKVYRQGSTE
ncbi:hypothetical protein FACS1894152_6900 [Bacilli bacterium]|nr:hypothetical protein FACS1894152_6900 [Bacilli bacterium]GHU31703.1 hypothetical protein FACS1894166_03630 [Bacilli bacterium]